MKKLPDLAMAKAFVVKKIPESIRALTYPGSKKVLLDSGLSVDFRKVGSALSPMA